MEKRRTHAHCYGNGLVHLPWKAVWRYFKKLKIELPYGPVIPLLGIYPKNPETPIQKNVWTFMFIAVLFTGATIWKQPKCPSVDEWIKKLGYIYIMEYHAAIKRRNAYFL